MIDLLYKTLGQRILKFILKRNGGDLEAAQVVLQDTFVSAYTSFHTFHNKSSYFTWLCRIALNKTADYYRREVHYRSHFIAPGLEELGKFMSPEISAEEKLSLDDLKHQINHSLDLLPSQYRQLLHLKYYQELSGRQICLKLHITPRQLEGRLYRARKQLALLLSGSGIIK